MSNELKHLIIDDSDGVNVLACGAGPSNTNCTKRPQEVNCQSCLDESGNVPED